MFRTTIAIGLLLLCIAPALHAQLLFDSSFSTPGFYVTHSPYLVSAAAAQPDGCLIVAGDFVRFNNQPSTNLLRLNADGSRDTSFDRTAKTNGQVGLIVVQADGKILIGGGFNTFKNQFIDRSVIRLNADGTLDNSFTAPVNIRHGWVSVDKLAAQADGKVLIWGYNVKEGFAGNALVRLNKNGTTDTSFHCNANLPADEAIFSIAPLADGRIYVGGNFTSFSGKARTHVARLLPNGALDTSFKAPVFSHYYPQPIYITALLPLADGSLYAGGSFVYCGMLETHGVVRLNSNGSADATFKIPSTINTQVVKRIDTSGTGIIVGGMFGNSSGQFMLLRVSANGAIDPTFSNTIPDPNYNTSYDLMDFAVLPDRSINTGGSFSATYGGTYVAGFAHFNAAGGIDTARRIMLQQIGAVYKTLVTTDGKILVGGNFDLYGSTAVHNVVRLLPNGNLDPTFQTSDGPDAIVTQIAETADNRIVIAGAFRKVGAATVKGVARLMADGSLDQSFATGAGPDWDQVNSIMPLADGKLLVGGPFAHFNGFARKGLVRLLANGQVDESFSVPSTPWYSIGSIGALQNGQVLVGDDSYWTNYDYSIPLRIWKVNTDGTVDAGFQTQNQGGFPVTHKISVSPAQRIYHSGEVIKPGSGPNNNFFTQPLIRLKTDGSNDTEAAQFPQTFYVSDFKLLSDSGILACGRNLGWNDSANYIMRFKPDLSIDSSFNPIAIYYNLRSLDALPDGRIVTAGEPVRFFNFDTEPIPNIAVLKSPSLQVRQQKNLVYNITGTVITDSVVTQLKIVNTGNTTAVLGNGTGSFVIVEGSGAPSFSISADRNIGSLAKGDSVLLTVRYKPVANGKQTAVVTIPYNNGIRQRYTFTLSGTAVVTSTPDVIADHSTIVYPNPSNGLFYVKSGLQKYQLTVYDALGRLIFGKEKLPANQLMPVWLKAAPRGLYWVRFTAGRHYEIRQVLLQ